VTVHAEQAHGSGAAECALDGDSVFLAHLLGDTRERCKPEAPDLTEVCRRALQVGTLP
jgi:hypothetical protein